MNLKDKNISWHDALQERLMFPPFNQHMEAFALAEFTSFPTAQQLNLLATSRCETTAILPTFEPNEGFVNDERYYEEIICQSGVVPTRENSWHDFFNALIWMQFPHTKGLLSKLHQQDIAEYGLNPRTKRRNHITHFDECGVILAVPKDRRQSGNELLSLLANHHWEEAFFQLKNEWEQTLFPVVFGHAMLEMLLQPFVGLTAKWLAVEVTNDYAELPYWARCAELDKALLKKIDALNNFTIEHPLKPLPVLGIPKWSCDQSAQFYQNKEYFRPLSQQNHWPEYLLLQS